METKKIDSLFRKSVNESQDYFETEADDAKSRIWSQVQQKNKKKAMPMLYRLLVAACILFFISTSVLMVSHLQTQKKIEALVVSNANLKSKVATNSQSISIKKASPIAENSNVTDTVYVEKKVTVTKSIIEKQRITDTVYIKQMVYATKETPPEMIAAIENDVATDSTFQNSSDNYKTEILIKNTKNLKKEKNKKFKFKFGGNRNSGNDVKLALTSKL